MPAAAALCLSGVTVWDLHALLLADGRASACGPAPAVLADEPLSTCFGVPVSVSRADGRWAARATPSW